MKSNGFDVWWAREDRRLVHICDEMNFLAARDRDEFLSVFERRHGRLVSANKPAIKYIKDDER